MELNIIQTIAMEQSKGVQNCQTKKKKSDEGRPIHQANSILYLGHMATEDGEWEGEVKRRIEIARAAFLAELQF